MTTGLASYSLVHSCCFSSITWGLSLIVATMIPRTTEHQYLPPNCEVSLPLEFLHCGTPSGCGVPAGQLQLLHFYWESQVQIGC